MNKPPHRSIKKSNTSIFPVDPTAILLTHKGAVIHFRQPGGEINKNWRNVVQTFQADLAIIGAGGAGLRAAIAAAQAIGLAV